MKGTESTRLSIRRRGRVARPPPGAREGGALHARGGTRRWRGSSGRSARWRRSASSTARTRPASAATSRARRRAAAWMVGACAMAPERVDLDGRFETDEDEDEAREKIMKRFEQIGTQIMQRAGAGGPFEQDPIAGVLGDPDKRALAAQLLGQAYVARPPRRAREPRRRRAHRRRADRAQEIHGDEVLDLLDGAEPRAARARSAGRRRLAEAMTTTEGETMPRGRPRRSRGADPPEEESRPARPLAGPEPETIAGGFGRLPCCSELIRPWPP